MTPFSLSTAMIIDSNPSPSGSEIRASARQATGASNKDEANRAAARIERSARDAHRKFGSNRRTRKFREAPRSDPGDHTLRHEALLELVRGHRDVDRSSASFEAEDDRHFAFDARIPVALKF